MCIRPSFRCCHASRTWYPPFPSILVISVAATPPWNTLFILSVHATTNTYFRFARLISPMLHIFKEAISSAATSNPTKANKHKNPSLTLGPPFKSVGTTNPLGGCVQFQASKMLRWLPYLGVYFPACCTRNLTCGHELTSKWRFALKQML